MDATTTRPVAVALEEVVSRTAHLLGRTIRRDQVQVAAGLALDRAALVVLRALDEAGPIRPSNLAELLLIDKPHATRQLQVLERLGLCTIDVDPTDARARLARVTPEGRCAALRLRRSAQEAVARSLRSWTDDDLAALGTLLDRMVTDFRRDQMEQER
jgi:DNA-binding MarR family transcriptional regulator